MPKNRSSAADHARTLELLWRKPVLGSSGLGASGRSGSGRGPRQGLRVDQVVKTAIELADAEGLDALTMRRVAQRLGVVPMSLYTYVPGKSALLVVMLDTVYA